MQSEKKYTGSAYKTLIAKTSQSNPYLYLPLWMHLRDTAGVMKKLILEWLPESAVRATGLSRQDLLKIAVFEAFVHDIGKAISLFQSIISTKISGVRERLINEGYSLLDSYRSPEKVRHSDAGMWTLLSEAGVFQLQKSICAVVGSHHGKTPTLDTLRGCDLLQQYPVEIYGTETDKSIIGKWRKAWEGIVCDALEAAGVKSTDELPTLNGNAQVLVTGWVIMADWFASNPEYFPLININDVPEQDSCQKRIEKAWIKMDLSKGWKPEYSHITSEIFASKFGFMPNDVQSAVMDISEHVSNPGICIIEANTGIGKTEAAFTASEIVAAKCGLNGFAFFAPTQATTNALFTKTYRCIGNANGKEMASINLAHSAAHLNKVFNQIPRFSEHNTPDVDSDNGGASVHSWFTGSKKSLLADIVVGTIDQFLLSVLKNKYFMLRHIGLVGKVVVIDEVHAYDAHMGVFLNTALAWLGAYGVPVILMSATLYPRKRKELMDSYLKAYAKFHGQNPVTGTNENNENREERRARVKCEREIRKRLNLKLEQLYKTPGYPLITWSDSLNVYQRVVTLNIQKKKVQIKKLFGKSSVSNLLSSVCKDGGSIAIIMNTVAEVQEMYHLVAECFKENDILVDHASFLAPDRAEIELTLLERVGKDADSKKRNGFIVIGTQVLQESLDYDVDLMITQPCPIDILIQRIGRLHRFYEQYLKKGIKRPEKFSEPVCYILMEDDGGYSQGTLAVYNSWIIKRSMQILPEVIVTPDDINGLIEAVYEEAYNPTDNSLSEELEQYLRIISEQTETGKNHVLRHPLSNDEAIFGMLDNEEKTKEPLAEATIRGGDYSLSVIAVKKFRNGAYGLLNSSIDDGIDPNSVPDNTVAKIISEYKIGLPLVFCTKWNIKQTLAKLEHDTETLHAWQSSPCLKEHLFLIFNENNEATLCGYNLKYTKELGLEKKKEAVNAKR